MKEDNTGKRKPSNCTLQTKGHMMGKIESIGPIRFEFPMILFQDTVTLDSTFPRPEGRIFLHSHFEDPKELIRARKTSHWLQETTTSSSLL